MRDLRSIKRTKWAKEFKKSAPISYQEAIYHVSQDNVKVEVRAHIQDDESAVFWTIEPKGYYFVLDYFNTEKEALELCKKMKWRVIS